MQTNFVVEKNMDDITRKTKKAWEQPRLFVMYATEEIRGGGVRNSFHEHGKVGATYFVQNAANTSTVSVNPGFYPLYVHS